MAALGYTDNVAFPWFAPAGFNRGGLSDGSSGIVATGVSKRLTSRERDELYDVNVNPIAQFPQEGVVIFGQKTLQSTRTALDRVNVRRLLIYVKKEISRIANSILFEPNVRDTWNRFIAQAEPFLDGVKADFGLTDYRLILDETTTTPELIDRNTLYARVLLKPARAIEFIAIDFEIFRSGASFDD
jgi:phage tail sheath protein FI